MWAPDYGIIRGAPGGVAPLDADGDVTDARGTKVVGGGPSRPEWDDLKSQTAELGRTKVTRRPDLIDIRDAAPSVDLGGTADARGDIQAVLDEAPTASRLYIPAGVTLNVSSGPVKPPRAVHIDGRGATLLAHGNGPAVTLDAGASGSTFTGLRVHGNKPTTYSATHTAFDIAGTPDEWVSDLRFTDVLVDGFGYAAFRAKLIKDSVWRGCAVSNGVYAGWLMMSARNVTLYDPIVSHLLGLLIASANTLQSYPIAWTRDRTQPIEQHPNSVDCTTWGGLIEHTGWEGVDTHGGINIRTIGTKIFGCRYGVSYVPCPDEAKVNKWAPINCMVRDCVIESGVSDGSKGAGIRLVGVGGDGGSISPMMATGGMYGNTIIGHGSDADKDGNPVDVNNVGGAIQVYFTRGVNISDNELVEPSPHGISTWHHNYDVMIGRNVITDAWSDTFAFPAAIAGRSAENSMTVGAVMLSRGTKQAKYVNQVGLYLGSDTVVTFAGGHNLSAAATPRSMKPGGYRVGVASKDPVTVPAVADNATVSDLIAALKVSGYIV